MGHHFYSRSQTDKKIYSLHEPHVDCISKGKTHKKYEFDSKVALSITHKKNRGIITSCQSIAGNPFDGHTLSSSLQMSEEITQIKVKEAYVGMGYKGHGVRNCQVYISGKRRGTTKKIRSDIKKAGHRAAYLVSKAKSEIGLVSFKRYCRRSSKCYTFSFSLQLETNNPTYQDYFCQNFMDNFKF